MPLFQFQQMLDWIRGALGDEGLYVTLNEMNNGAVLGNPFCQLGARAHRNKTAYKVACTTKTTNVIYKDIRYEYEYSIQTLCRTPYL